MANTPDPRDGYSESFFEALAGIEDRHFWFRARNRLLRSTVRDLIERLPPGFRVLEAGCGNGNVLRLISSTAAAGVVVGIDLFEEGLRLARKRSGALLVQGDVHFSPFQCKFDVIGAFDVIEHLHDDRKALRDLRELLSPNGALLLTAPAHNSLWSSFDRISGHYRRYSGNELRAVLLECGYRVEYMTEFMMALYPLMWIGRHITAKFGKHNSAPGDLPADFRVVPVLNEILMLLLWWELPLIRRSIRLPWGTSLLAIARRA